MPQHLLQRAALAAQMFDIGFLILSQRNDFHGGWRDLGWKIQPRQGLELRAYSPHQVKTGPRRTSFSLLEPRPKIRKLNFKTQWEWTTLSWSAAWILTIIWERESVCGSECELCAGHCWRLEAGSTSCALCRSGSRLKVVVVIISHFKNCTSKKPSGHI